MKVCVCEERRGGALGVGSFLGVCAVCFSPRVVLLGGQREPVFLQ